MLVSLLEAGGGREGGRQHRILQGWLADFLYKELLEFFFFFNQMVMWVKTEKKRGTEPKLPWCCPPIEIRLIMGGEGHLWATALLRRKKGLSPLAVGWKSITNNQSLRLRHSFSVVLQGHRVSGFSSDITKYKFLFFHRKWVKFRKASGMGTL